MASRKALGRGLSALIAPSEAGVARKPPGAPPIDSADKLEATEYIDDSIGSPLFIEISKIVPNPRQPRKTFREEPIESLANSIREQGVLQPLVVRRSGDRYELIIGERRWRASQRAGLREVPAVLLDASDRAALEMAVVENVQRADLNVIELAQAVRALLEDEGMTQEKVALRLGLDRSTVSNYLRILDLPGIIREDLVEGRLTPGHAKALLQAPETQRVTLRHRIVRGHLSVRASEELCRRTASSKGPSRGPGRLRRDVHVVDLEDRLRRAVQARVRIVGRKDRGRIELHYHGAEELERLIELLGGAGA